MHFLSYFYSKNGHISVENHHIGKKSKLVLKTTFKKFLLKYQDNARFPSLCLASENGFLSYIFTQKNGSKTAITQLKMIAREKIYPGLF